MGERGKGEKIRKRGKGDGEKRRSEDQHSRHSGRGMAVSRNPAQLVIARSIEVDEATRQSLGIPIQLKAIKAITQSYAEAARW